MISDTLQSLGRLSLSNPHRVLVLGCAYGGLSAVVNLLDLDQGKGLRPSGCNAADFTGKRSKAGLEVTVIDERDGYFHAVGAPLAHVTPKHTKTMWKRFSQCNELRRPNLHFKHGSAKRLDAESKVVEWHDRDGKIHHQAYDYLVMATGLKRHWPAVPKSGSYEEYLKDGKAFVSKIVGGDPKNPQQGRKVAVIGAGAVGVEFAGKIKNYYPGIEVTLIHSREQVLSSEPLPLDVKNKVKDILVEEGVQLLLGSRATITEQEDGHFNVELADGRMLTVDFVIDSTQKGTPTTGILPDSCLNSDKEIVVKDNLSFAGNIANASSHFGVGDVIAWSGIKRAGSAMVMGQIAAHNIFAAVMNSESPDTPSEAQFEDIELTRWPPVIGIAVGKQCLVWGEESGMKYGVDVMEDYFQDDLGWASNLRYMQLTDVVEDEKRPEIVQMSEVGVEVVAAA